MMLHYKGYKVILEPELVDMKIVPVQRSWPERIFSWPWNPWTSTKTVMLKTPHKDALIYGDTMIIHPQAFEHLKQLDATGQTRYPLQRLEIP